MNVQNESNSKSHLNKAKPALFYLMRSLRRRLVVIRGWRFRFRLRSLFLLTLIAALWSWWYARQREAEARYADAYDAIRGVGGSFTSGFHEVLFRDSSDPGFVARLSDEQLAPIIDALAKCDAPYSLDLSNTQITDASVAQIPKLRSLRHLNLAFTAITDEGLRHLRNGPPLYHLRLNGTKVTSAGMEALAGQSELRELYVDAESVSYESVEDLKKSIPSLHVS